MFSQEELNAAWNSAPAPKQKKKKQQQKGFWLDQISTGTGIGGALGGAAAGAAAGSVLPGVGTAVGGILGALLGGGLGSAGGEIGENAITGDQWNKNVGREALIGGVTSLPIGAGLKLARAGLKSSTGLGKRSASDLVQEAGVQTIGKGAVARNSGMFDQGATDALARLNGIGTKQALKSSVAGRLKTSGNNALASQYGVLSAPVRRSADPARTVQELAEIGITKPADAERIGSAITGSEGLLTQTVTKAVGNSADVDTSTMRQVFNDALDNYGIVEKDRKSLQTLFDAQMNKLSGGARGSLNPKVNPTEALQTMKAFEKRIANLRGKGGNYRMTTPEREDAANVLQLVRDEMEDQLYVGAGANANLKNVLTPELREKLVALKPKDKAWASYVDNNIMKATDVGQLRSAQSPFVRVGQMIDEGEDAMFSMGGRLAPSANGIRGALLDGATNLVRNPAARGYAAATRRADSVPRLGGAGVGQSLAGATVRQAGGRGILGALSGSEPQQAPEEALAAQLAAEGAQTAPEQQIEPSIGGVTKSQLEEAMMMAAADGNEDAFKQLQTIYEMLPSGTSDLNASSQKDLTSLDSVGNQVNNLDALYDQAGGGNELQGRLASFAGSVGFNDNARQYNDSVAALAREYGRAMGEGASGSNADAEAYQSIIPRLTDSPELKAQKIAALKQQLALRRQAIMQYSGSSQ